MSSNNVVTSLNQVRAAVELVKHSPENDEETVKKAERALRDAIELDQSNLYAWYNLAVLLTRISRKEEGIELFKQVLHIKPHFEDAWVSLALADIPNSLPRLNEGLRLCPWSAVIWNALGSVLSGLDRKEDAEKAFLSATKVDPKYEPAWMNVANIYAQTGRREEAEYMLQKAYGGRLFPRFKEMEKRHLDYLETLEELSSGLGIRIPRSSFLESEMSTSKGAMIFSVTYIKPSDENELRNKLSKNPTIAWLWFELGELYMKLGRHDEAEKSVRRAIKLGSNNRWKNLVLAQILQAIGKLEEAFSEILIAADDNKTSCQTWRVLKEISESLGKKKDAKIAEGNITQFQPRF